MGRCFSNEKYTLTDELWRYVERLTLPDLLAELRKESIKGSKDSTDNNPVANLLLFKYLEYVDSINVNFYIAPHNKKWSAEPSIPAGKVIWSFLAEFNEGLYPEFEE